MQTKRFFLAIILLTFVMSSQAQFKYGIRVGISSSNIKLTDVASNPYKLEYNKGQYGYHFGVMGRLKVASFFVQPELLFSTSKTDIALIDPATGIKELGRQNFNKIDIPVMLGFKVLIFKLQAGPVATFMLNSKSDLLDEYAIEQATKGATIGYQAGVGVELGNLLLDVKYEGNLSSLGSGMTVAGSTVTFDQRMSQILFSIGYLF